MTQIDRIENKLDRIMDKVVEQNVYLARVDERLAALESDFASHVEDDKTLSNRLGKIEKWSWTVAGAFTALSVGTQLLLKMVK